MPMTATEPAIEYTHFPYGRPMWIYVARSECRQYVKIGITTVIATKLGQIRGQAKKILGVEIEWHFLALFPGDLDFEVEIQDKFAQLLIRGTEWFRCDECILRFTRTCSMAAPKPRNNRPFNTSPEIFRRNGKTVDDSPGRGHKKSDTITGSKS